MMEEIYPNLTLLMKIYELKHTRNPEPQQEEEEETNVCQIM